MCTECRCGRVGCWRHTPFPGLVPRRARALRLDLQPDPRGRADAASLGQAHPLDPLLIEAEEVAELMQEGDRDLLSEITDAQ